MLTRTATRRSAAVLMMALVAMLLVATNARAAQARTSVGTGHASAAPHAGRHAAAIPPAVHDQSPLHLDLATTPPVDADDSGDGVVDRSAGPELSPAPGLTVAPAGRAPPAR